MKKNVRPVLDIDSIDRIFYLIDEVQRELRLSSIFFENLRDPDHSIEKLRDFSIALDRMASSLSCADQLLDSERKK